MYLQGVIMRWSNSEVLLRHLKTKVDKLDAGELKTVSVDLKKLSDVLDIKSC